MKFATPTQGKQHTGPASPSRSQPLQQITDTRTESLVQRRSLELIGNSQQTAQLRQHASLLADSAPVLQMRSVIHSMHHVPARPLAAGKGAVTQLAGSKTRLTDDEELDLTSYGGSAELLNQFDEELVLNTLAGIDGKDDSLLNQVSATSESVEEKKKANEVLKDIPSAYLQAIYGYTLSGYSALNPALRKQTKADLLKYKNYILAASAGLSMMPKFAGTVYRGTNLTEDVLKTYKKGEIITEKSFTSTTTIEKEGKVGFGGNVLYVIESVNGRDVSMLANDESEGEVLFAPGTRFEVLDISEDPVKKKERTIITMKEAG